MKVLTDLRIELIARIHGYKVKAEYKQGGMLIDIYEKIERCRDFETFLRLEFDLQLGNSGFFYHTKIRDRLKFRLGMIK